MKKNTFNLIVSHYWIISITYFTVLNYIKYDISRTKHTVSTNLITKSLKPCNLHQFAWKLHFFNIHLVYMINIENKSDAKHERWKNDLHSGTVQKWKYVADERKQKTTTTTIQKLYRKLHDVEWLNTLKKPKCASQQRIVYDVSVHG